MSPLKRRRPVASVYSLRRLGHERVAVIVEPIDQRPDRREILILDQRRVVVGADQAAALAEFLQQLAVVDVEGEALGGGIEIGAVDEDGDALVGMDRGDRAWS